MRDHYARAQSTRVPLSLTIDAVQPIRTYHGPSDPLEPLPADAVSLAHWVAYANSRPWHIVAVGAPAHPPYNAVIRVTVNVRTTQDFLATLRPVNYEIDRTMDRARGIPSIWRCAVCGSEEWPDRRLTDLFADDAAPGASESGGKKGAGGVLP